MEMTDAMRRCMHRPPTLRAPIPAPASHVLPPEAQNHPAAPPEPQKPVAGESEANDHHHHSSLPNPKQRKRPKALEGSGEGEAQGARPPLVSFTLCRVSLLDVDAKWASVKDLLDGLRYAGLICGDKEGEICLEVRQEKVRKKVDEKTVIEVEVR